MKGSKREEKPRREEILKTITVAVERRIPSSKMKERERERKGESEEIPLSAEKVLPKAWFYIITEPLKEWVD